MVKIFSMMEDSRFSDFTDVLGYLGNAVVLNCGDISQARSRCSLFHPSVLSIDEEKAYLLPVFTSLLCWNIYKTGSVLLETCKGTFALTLAVGEELADCMPETLFGQKMRAAEFLMKIRESVRKARSQDKISRVRTFFSKIGLYSNLVGYDYLLEAVNGAVKDPASLKNLSVNVYPRIAEQHNTSAKCVERGIRNAIDVVVSRGRLTDVANRDYGAYFGKYERMTNGRFLAFVVQNVVGDERSNAE